MSQKAKKKIKGKKVSFKDKHWYQILTPKIFDFKPIGDVIGTEGTLVGRALETLLFDFTNRYSDISLKLRFKVTDVNEEARKCNSMFIGHANTNDFIRSLVGRGSTKVKTIINLTTKDKYIYRVTMICTTLKRALSSQQILIRKIMREILREFATGLNHEKFIAGMIYGEFQSQVKRVAKTIYPLSNAVIIKSKLISFPEGGQDEAIPDDEFDIVEVDIKRSRKSEIRRSERINVKKLASKNRHKNKTYKPTTPTPQKIEDKPEDKPEVKSSDSE